MKKLELKNLKIKTLSEDGQANINGGRKAYAPGTLVDSHCSPSYTCLLEIPDAPGNPCKYNPLSIRFDNII